MLLAGLHFLVGLLPGSDTSVLGVAGLVGGVSLTAVLILFAVSYQLFCSFS